MAEIITTENLTKVYRGGIKAVDGVSFAVREGEIFGFLGPNGAGKSTTIAMLITLLRPTAGEARVAGYDLHRAAEKVRKSIGYVSQDIAVDDTLTGRENLFLQGHFYHLPLVEIRRRTQEVLAMVDLADRADDLVQSYSGGMRKRLDIAEGLLHRPRVLFLDEPTLGLDIQTRRRIWDYVERLRREEGITIFLTTHYMEEADSLCDRVAIIDHGRIVALGTPEELKQRIGGDLITLTLADGRKLEVLRQWLGGLSEVKGITQGENGTFNLVVSQGEVAIPKVMATLAQAGTVVKSLALKRPSLDDVFIHYTGRELRENEGAEAYRRTTIALRRARH